MTTSSWPSIPNTRMEAEVEVSELMGAEIYLYMTFKGQNMMPAWRPPPRPAAATRSPWLLTRTRSISLTRRTELDCPELI